MIYRYIREIDTDMEIYIENEKIQLVLSSNVELTNFDDKIVIIFNKCETQFIAKKFMYFDYYYDKHEFIEEDIINSKVLKILNTHNIILNNDSEISLNPEFLLKLL